MKRHRLTEDEEKTIIERYSIKLERLEDLASEYHVTRQALWKMLKHNRIDTSKGVRVKRICRACGKTVLRRRCKARTTEHSYCDADCYSIYLETLGEDYKPSNYYARKSREEVRRLWPDYDPAVGHTVHHVDKDVTHWHGKNLEVYACQGDHLRKHRGQDIQPIWKGSAL